MFKNFVGWVSRSLDTLSTVEWINVTTRSQSRRFWGLGDKDVENRSVGGRNATKRDLPASYPLQRSLPSCCSLSSRVFISHYLDPAVRIFSLPILDRLLVCTSLHFINNFRYFLILSPTCLFSFILTNSLDYLVTISSVSIGSLSFSRLCPKLPNVSWRGRSRVIRDSVRLIRRTYATLTFSRFWPLSFY